MVMMRSFMACSSAAWVFGGVRLVPSASRSWVKIGPLVSTKVLVWKLKRLVPSTSPGIRSGVNWMRPNCSARPAAKAWVSSVLAVPGTPSSRMCPPTSRLVSISSMTSSWPPPAFRTSLRIPSATARISPSSINNLPFPTVNIAHDRNERRQVAAAAVLEVVGSRMDRAAIDRNGAHLADTLQPFDERPLGQPARRMQLARHFADRRIDVATNDRALISGEVDQPCRIADKAALAGVERRRGRGGRAEPHHRPREQQRDRQHGL